MRHHTTTAGLVTGTLLAAGLTAGLAPGLTATATAASGAGAFRLYVPEEWDGTSHWAADDNPCGAWATTFHEVRHGGYRLLVAPGGQVEGEVHINGSVDGWVELTPDDPSLPSYSGGYREKVDGVLTDPDNDQFRVFRFRLRDRLAGTDGSTLTIVLSGRATMNARGRLVTESSVETCG
jgi:hypothetical protein